MAFGGAPRGRGGGGRGGAGGRGGGFSRGGARGGGRGTVSLVPRDKLPQHF